MGRSAYNLGAGFREGSGVGAPLVVHGSDDTLVPVSEGRALAAAVPGAEFHALPCGHNDCPRPWRLIQQFLDTHVHGNPAPVTR